MNSLWQQQHQRELLDKLRRGDPNIEKIMKEKFDKVRKEQKLMKMQEKMGWQVEIVLPIKLRCNTCEIITEKCQKFKAFREKIGMDPVSAVEIYRYKFMCPTATCLAVFSLIQNPGRTIEEHLAFLSLIQDPDRKDFTIEEGATIVQ